MFKLTKINYFDTGSLAKYGNMIFRSNSIFMGLDVWESNYESNGSFGNENGVRTRKLGPKRRKRRKRKKAVALGDIARDYAILAMSRGIVAWCNGSQQIHSEDHVLWARMTARLTRDYATWAMSRVLATLACD